MFFNNYAKWCSFRFKGHKFLALHRRDRTVLVVGANMENYGGYWSLNQFKKAWVAGHCEDLRTQEEKERCPAPAVLPEAKEGEAQLVWKDDDGRTLWFAKTATDTGRTPTPLGKRGYWYYTGTKGELIHIGLTKKEVRYWLPNVTL